MTSRSAFADAALSLAHLSEIDVPPLDLLAAAHTAGLSSIGIRITPAAPGGLAYPLATGEEQRAMRRRIDETGVAVMYIELITLDAATRAGDHLAMFEAGAAIGASRVCVCGDHGDVALMADKFSVICEAARPFGLAVDLEFMPFRAVANLALALDVVTTARQPNGHILIDALHMFRSRSSIDLLSTIDRAYLGTVQLCDAPATPPPRDDLMLEARTRRLPPGHGTLDLRGLIEALPADIPVGLEVPNAAASADGSPAERLTRLVTATRTFLTGKPTK